VNPGGAGVELGPLKSLLPLAIDAATEHLFERREAFETDLLHRMESYRSQLQSWTQLSLIRLGEQVGAAGEKKERVAEIADETSRLIDSLAPSGDPYVRVIGIIAPRKAGG